MKRPWILVDLEATCWEDGDELKRRQQEISEIIEIGAVRFDPVKREMLDTFQTFVRPLQYPVLTKFCTQLTTIKTEDVVDAPAFGAAYRSFAEWAKFEPGQVMGSWGQYDDRQLRRECLRNDQPTPVWEAVNVKNRFTQWVRSTRHQRRRFGLTNALNLLGMEPEGQPHRALTDAISVARLCQVMLDPNKASEQAREVLTVLQTTGRLNVAGARKHWSNPKVWWSRVSSELLDLGVVEQLPHGQGLRVKHG